MHGGSRRNSGVKKGSKHLATLSKEAAREVLRQIVLTEMRDMAQAQIDSAKGIKHLMIRQADGRFERLRHDDGDSEMQKEQIDAALANGKAFWIYTKDPSVQAFTDLMNRALDKPAEQEQALAVSGELKITWQSKPQ